MTVSTFQNDGYALVDLRQQCSLCEDSSLVDAFTNPCAHGFHESCLDGLGKLNGKVTLSCPSCDETLLAQRYILRTKRFTDHSLSSERCTICYDPLDAANTCLTVCGHVFHDQESCLPGWVSRHASHPTCSDCRTELPFQGIWKTIRQYISYEEQQYLIKTIVALGVVFGAWATILGTYLLSPPIMATGAIAVLSSLTIDSLNRNNLPDLFLSIGLLASVISFTTQAYFIGIVVLSATIYFQNFEENQA